MAKRKAKESTLLADFRIGSRTSGDPKTNRIQIVIPKGWRFISLNASEGRVGLSFKQVKAELKASRSVGYARDRQRLIEGWAVHSG